MCVLQYFNDKELDCHVAADMQWTGQDLAAENYMMPFGPSAFNPYWTGMQPGMDGFMPPYNGHMPYMGYGLGPMDVAFGGVMPQDPFGGPGFMMPYGGLPQRCASVFLLIFSLTHAHTHARSFARPWRVV